ncbi:UNVERIFIED_CONTAM: hypothetical protein FKN15_031582 [Acipenser sinensis]
MDEEKRRACWLVGRSSGLSREGLPGLMWGMQPLVLVVLVSMLSGLASLAEGKECDKPCLNGQCNPTVGNCICEPGWAGDQCQHCGGRFSVTVMSIAERQNQGNAHVDSPLANLPNEDINKL